MKPLQLLAHSLLRSERVDAVLVLTVNHEGVLQVGQVIAGDEPDLILARYKWMAGALRQLADQVELGPSTEHEIVLAAAPKGVA